MAVNNEGRRLGAVRNRVQAQENGVWVKRTLDTGKVVGVKVGEPFKGVSKREPRRA